MENTSVSTASGTGITVDVIQTSDSDVRQVVVLGDSETDSLIKVDPTTSALAVSSVNSISVAATVSGVLGVSGYDSDDVKVTLDSEVVTVAQQGVVSVDDNGGSLTVDGTVSVGNFPSTQAVSGTVSVDNLPTTQAVSGTISVDNLPSTQAVSGYDSADVKVTLDSEVVTVAQQGTVSVDDNGGSLTVDGTVSVGNFPSTQAVSGTVSVDNLPSTQAVSGYDSADVKVTLDSEVVSIDDNGGSLTVDGTVSVDNLPSTQAVSGYDSADVKVSLDSEEVNVDIIKVNNTAFAGASLPISLNTVGSLTASKPVPTGFHINPSSVFLNNTVNSTFNTLLTIGSGDQARVFGVVGVSRATSSVLIEFAKSTGSPDTGVPSSDGFLYMAIPAGYSSTQMITPNFITLADNEDVYVRAIGANTPGGTTHVLAQIYYDII